MRNLTSDHVFEHDTEPLGIHEKEQAESDSSGVESPALLSLATESGANLAEYSILVLLLLCIALIAIKSVGMQVSTILSHNARAIEEASG
jgi:hypothetical protein